MLAHLVLAHDKPKQLQRLVSRLCHKDDHIYIHLDAKAAFHSFEALSSMPGVHFIRKNIKVVWGEYSIVQATLNSLMEILGSGNHYSHINILSGRDYPLQSATKIHDFFAENTGKSFVWYDKIFNDWVHGQVRIKQYDFGDYGFPGRFAMAKIVNKVMPARKLPDGFTAYGRSQWMTLTPEAAEFSLKYIKDHPALERFFRMTWAVDEVFFQTILCNSPLIDSIVNDNLRYIELDPGFRPVVYNMSHANALVNSGKLYARKFDIDLDSGIFDYIDKNAGV